MKIVVGNLGCAQAQIRLKIQEGLTLLFFLHFYPLAKFNIFGIVKGMNKGLPKTYLYLGLATTGMFVATGLIQQRTIFAIYGVISLLATTALMAYSFIKNKEK